MMGGRRALACGYAISSGSLVVACTLTTPLDGYSSGGVPLDGGAATSDSGPGDGPLSAYAAAVRADKPVAWWRFGEQSGTRAKDEMGTETGTYVGGVTLGVQGAIVGESDTAASFDGRGALVRIADAFEFAGTRPFSIELWVNPTTLAGERRLASRRTTGLIPTGYKVSLSDGTLQFDRWQNGDVRGATASATLPGAGRWTHVVATYDGAQLRLFVDGAPAGSAPSPDTISSAATSFVWASTSGEDTQYFAGSLDEVAIYDRALDGARIAVHTRAAGH